jgi:hypothetical protein
MLEQPSMTDQDVDGSPAAHLLVGAGLPDGIISNPKVQIWVNLGEDIDKFYGNLVYFTTIRYINFIDI